MKSIIRYLADINPILFLSIYIIALKKRWVFHIILILSVLSISGCFLHYYKTNSTNKVDAATMQRLINGDKYFILHANHYPFALKNVKAGNDIIEGDVDTLPEEHLKYLRPKVQGENRFAIKNKDIVLYEVHLYTQDSVAYNSHISIPFNHFNQLDVYGPDKGPTTRSRVISIVGVTITTALVAAVIIGASTTLHFGNTSGNVGTSSSASSSCSPRVYVLNGGQSELKGTLYSGAIFASLERTDYLPLPAIYPVNDKMSLQIKGEKNEELIIDEIKLLQVTHQTGNKVLVDRNGKVLVYQQPLAPERATVGGKEDIKMDVMACDGKYYSFTNHSRDRNTSDIILDFKKPVGTTSGKLVLRAKNSGWSGYLFRNYESLYGESYPAMIQKKDKADTELVLQCELDQTLPLLVSVKEGDGWKSIGYFITPGNAAPRDMIMELNLAGLRDSDHIEVRLETTYMFWDLDYAGMDFSENLPYSSTFLSATEIYKSDSTSQLKELSQKDKIYTHITGKEQLNIGFRVQSADGGGSVNSYFLMGSGYYHENSRYEGKPQLNELYTFSGKGAFDKYSRKKMEELIYKINNYESKDTTIKK